MFEDVQNKPAKIGRLRKKQTRTVETRRQLLDAALIEFAESGFDGVNIRDIAERAGVKHQLISYHFDGKHDLWKATASHVIGEIQSLFAEGNDHFVDATATNLLRQEVEKLLAFNLDHPHFHKFMMQENVPGNPRLEWLVNTHLRPIMEAQIRLIKKAQEEGGIIEGDPMFIYYLLLGSLTIVPSLHEEIVLLSGSVQNSSVTVAQYWPILERAIFKGQS
jgi:TetR/AcrR family transcriptional regulator